MSAPTPRLLAVERLLRIEGDGAFVARLTDRRLPPEVSRQAVDLVAGVTRWRRWLDFVLAAYVRRPLDTLDPELHQVLRIGAYDLLIRETAPHAAVNEAVEAVKALLNKGAAGVANGTLRSVDRAARRQTLPEPATGDAAEDLAIRSSHPTWMVRRWLGRESADVVQRLIDHNNAPARYTLRASAGATGVPKLVDSLEALSVEASPSPWADDFVEVNRLQPVLRGGLIETGMCSVQDVAAGLVVRVLAPKPGVRVLDAAAAPGGKAIYAAQRMGGEGEVVALDVSEAKARLVQQAADRQQAGIVRTVTHDLITWDGDGPFDLVLLDAPCSGTGVLGKRADLRWRRRSEDLSELVDLQDRMLNAAARYVCVGGELVYSTCSIEPEENDERVKHFLDSHPGFALMTVRGRVPATFVDGDVYRALPHHHGTDGAFAARLSRIS